MSSFTSFGASRGLKIATPDNDVKFSATLEKFDSFGDVYGPARENSDHEPEEVVLSPRSEVRLDKLLFGTVKRCLGEDLVNSRGLYFSCEVDVAQEGNCEMEPSHALGVGAKRKRAIELAAEECEIEYESPDDASPTSVVWHDWKKVDKEPGSGKGNLDEEIGAARHVEEPSSRATDDETTTEGRERPSKRATLEDGAAIDGRDWISGLCANALRDTQTVVAAAASEPEQASEETEGDGHCRLPAEVRVACTA